MKICVLVTSLGSNNSIGVIKALRTNTQIEVIGTDTNDRRRCNGVAFADKVFKVPLYSDSDYVNVINEIIRSKDVKCLIPVHDREIETISKNREQIEPCCPVACNPYQTILTCNDKHKAASYLQRLVKIPRIFNKLDEVKFPAICKPISGVSSRGISVHEDSLTLCNFNPKTHFLQEFVNGTEYTVDCYTSYQTGEFFYGVRERIETKDGMSVKGRLLDDPELGSFCRNIHTELNYRGVSNIQFIRDSDGQVYFIEINPRFAGGGTLTYMHGLNMPMATLQELVFGEPPSLRQSDLKQNVNMVRYLSETYLDDEGNLI